ncbi:uncharacterized protein LOC143742212 [Siphateles boraxobius]|uniref:uncharacterized protein LOC143742212 n=1 Tax=Siphateles boraxobius TaxID=180520 RepID=UPI0040634165
MQGYTWSSNQRPPPQYQEQTPLHYQEQFLPRYQDVRNEQPNMFQAQFNAQHYTTSQTRYSTGQQETSNHCQSFQSNFHGYNTQTNQAHSQYLCAASNTQQHYPSENPNTNGYHAQFGTQSNVSSAQNYGNPGGNEAHMYRSPQSDRGSSVDNRSWRFHMYNNGSSFSMNNQQQLQPPRTAPRHHQQQQFSRQHSGKKRKMHNRIQGHHPQSSSWAHRNGVSQRISNNQAQSQTVASYTSCNSTTPPSGAQSKISLPSNNLNQSSVTHNQPELRSNVGPDVSATHSQNNHSTEQQSQGTNGGTYNNNETSQMTCTNEAQSDPHSRFVNSLIYKFLISNDNEQAGKQQSDERNAHHNTYSEQSEVCATNKTDHHSHFSKPSVQCTVEAPSKRMKYAVVQRDYWNKDTSVTKDRSDFGVQSVQPGTHHTGSNKNRPKGMSQHNIQYSTDPADCLEAVFALKKLSQQVHKAIAIVPPISQQTSNTAQMPDASPKKADSPPLKIDSVWSVVEECDSQKTADDKLSESPSPTAQQEDKSLEIETTSNIADTDICSTSSPVECQNNVQQGDCDSSDTSFDLSSVPVVKYTLEKLMDLVKSLEMTELSTEYPEKSESFINTILKLYWNGNIANLGETLKSFRKEVEKHSSVEIVRDYESVVFESIETENLKKLAHCDVLNDEMYSSSEEYRSSWLNVDGQAADIEKVLSEPQLDDITVIHPNDSDNTIVTLANLSVNSLKDAHKVSSDEKSVKPDSCSPKALFTPQSGNDREEIATENNGHSHAGLSRITSLSSISIEEETFLSSISSENETFKKQEDIKQNHNFNTKPSDNFPLAERSTEKPTACSDEMEIFRQDHYEQTRHNVSVSDSLPLSPEDNVSDGVKNSEESFSTETLCNSKDTWQMEDISEDENPGNKEALNNFLDTGLVEDISEDENPGNKEVLPISSDICHVEDISDDENPGNKEALPISSDICHVEDISDDENPGNKEVLPISSDICHVEDISDDDNPGNKEVLPISSDIWHVEDISDDENPGNKDTRSNSPDIYVVEDVSNDENSRDDSLLMEITVLSSEDAKTFFQQLEDEPVCGIKTTTSKFDCPDLVVCHEYNKADICSLCGTKMALSNSTNVKNSDGDLFCFQCWEQAPLLELEEQPCSPMTNEADVLGSPAKSNKQGQDCSPLCLKLEVKELNVASQKECIVDERLTRQRSDHMIKSEEDKNSPSLELKDKELKVASPETCVVNEGPTGQKRDTMVKSELEQTCNPPFLDLKGKELTVTSTKKCNVDEGLTRRKSDSMAKSELGENCCSPYLDLKVKEQTVASLKESIGNERLTGQKCDGMVKSERGQTRSPPFLDLKVKELTVTSTKKCIVDEGLTGQKCFSMVKSEMGQYRNSPSLELKVNEPTVAPTEERIDEGLTGPKSKSLFKSKLRQDCSPPSLRLQIKMPNVSSTEERTENERLTGRKRESMVKSELRQNFSRPSLELEVNEPTVASTEERTEDERLMGPKSERFIKSGLGQNCSFSSLEMEVKVPNVASPEDCVADEGLTGQKSDSMVKSPTQNVPEIQRPAEHEKSYKMDKKRLAKHQCNKPPSKKSAFLKHKLKSGSKRTGSVDAVLFTPDIVVKKIAKKRPSGGSQDCSKAKKLKEHRKERQVCPDRTSPHHRENPQKVTEKVPAHSNDTLHQKSKKKLELCGILSVNKTKTTEPKKVRFDLYGSNGENQINIPGRRFSAPATLTVSNNCIEYTDGLSAKQKVHNQWSSTFIPKTKTFSPRSPQKKKTQKTQDCINMTALKSHLTHRASLLSSSERETNPFRKPGFHQKLTKSLSS